MTCAGTAGVRHTQRLRIDGPLPRFKQRVVSGQVTNGGRGEGVRGEVSIEDRYLTRDGFFTARGCGRALRLQPRATPSPHGFILAPSPLPLSPGGRLVDGMRFRQPGERAVSLLMRETSRCSLPTPSAGTPRAPGWPRRRYTPSSRASRRASG